jgi:hypothetical protein
MDCRESQALLQRRLDGESAVEPAELAQHVADCPGCRDLHAGAGPLMHGLQRLRAAAPPGHLTHWIVAQVLLAERARLLWRRRLRLTAAVAASLLVAAVVGYLQPWRGTQPAQRSGQDVARQQQPADPPHSRPEPPYAEPGPSLNDSVRQASSALVSLSQRTARETLGPGRRLLLPEVASPRTGTAPEVLAQTLQPPVRSLRQAGAGVSAGVEPVTRATGRALQLFFEEIPSLQTDKPAGL